MLQLGRSSCPAYNITCHFCSKQGHFAKVCLQKQKRMQNSSKSQEHSNSGKQIKHVVQQTASTSQLKQNDENNANYTSYDNEESDQSFNLMVNKITSLPRVTIEVNGIQLNFIIDTGTSVNLISERTFQRMFNEILVPDTIKIFPYCQTEKLEVLGKFTATLKHNNNSMVSEIHVVKGHSESLLSYEASKNLNIIEILTNFIQQNINLQYVEKHYPELCQGVGNLKNVEIKLH